ncbi:carboxymuconolactone decarboxylase family protein [Aggregatibacter kilianii]|uniref:carboxymuconolactone decarboxylase family protein n=1 Tax=Aggregatibacter kilianii TaxID=2025884 RepID=UPI000D65E69B|nr:carboxymuconolactone decarboxylase family protein [Aggregatibacter kilianii]
MILTPTQQALAAVAVATATGDQKTLTKQLNQAFDADRLTVNQAKSAMEQLYAYCGFPRSLNALSTLMTVVNARQTQHKPTKAGVAAAPLPADTDLLALGEQVQTELAGQKVAGPLFDFSPHIDRYLKRHLFGDIFSDNRLTHQEREIVTIAALGSMDGVQSQFESHIRLGKNVGLSDEQIIEIKRIIALKDRDESAGKEGVGNGDYH